MVEAEVIVTNEAGLHSRPADLFVRTAKLYESSVIVRKGEKSANAKNIIKVILLNVRPGESIRIIADGPDADAAITDLTRLVESDFEAVNVAVHA